MVNSKTLRHIWLILEQTQAQRILELSDSDLLVRVQKQLEAQIFLSDSELNNANIYINSRLPLIRDLAQSRLVGA